MIHLKRVTSCIHDTVILPRQEGKFYPPSYQYDGGVVFPLSQGSLGKPSFLWRGKCLCCLKRSLTKWIF